MPARHGPLAPAPLRTSVTWCSPGGCTLTWSPGVVPVLQGSFSSAVGESALGPARRDLVADLVPLRTELGDGGVDVPRRLQRDRIQDETQRAQLISGFRSPDTTACVRRGGLAGEAHSRRPARRHAAAATGGAAASDHGPFRGGCGRGRTARGYGAARSRQHGRREACCPPDPRTAAPGGHSPGSASAP